MEFSKRELEGLRVIAENICFEATRDCMGNWSWWDDENTMEALDDLLGEERADEFHPVHLRPHVEIDVHVSLKKAV